MKSLTFSSLSCKMDKAGGRSITLGYVSGLGCCDMVRLHLIFFLLLSAPSGILGAAPPDGTAAVHTAISSSTLVYVSDYFSFVGTDGQGHVVFALDTNRGRDGDAFQAEHFVVLHAERQGWIDVAGNGRYENTKKELLTIPDSPFFHFEGTPEAGITITSAKNQLTLKVDPLPQRHRRSIGNAALWMGSASAVLTWQGRTVPGRVIYEHLLMPDFNRLTRTYVSLWKEFQGLYLLTDGNGDLYVHSQQSERFAPLAGKLVGFAVWAEQTETLEDLDLLVLDHEFAFGFYRWPTEWRIRWQGEKGPGSMTLFLSERKGIMNWVTGGFAMGLIRGEVTYNGRTRPVYGLAELLM